MQEIIEKQGGFAYLDSPPKTVTSQPHRPAYATDGDYFSKPSVDDIVEAAYAIMNEVNPSNYPDFLKG
jgi:pyruvate/2-oxoglutarate/acetoin dehydrogenase E1 component